MGRALASNTIRGVNPAAAQAASSAARTPVPRGRLTGEEFGQDRQRAPADHAHRDLPAHQAGQVVDGLPGVRHRVQRGPREREDGRPHLGQPDRTAGPVQQLLAELGLQPADLRAHPGLRHVHPARRPGKTGLLGDRHEILQLVKFHNWRF
jgi:hypothetical protein